MRSKPSTIALAAAALVAIALAGPAAVARAQQQSGKPDSVKASSITERYRYRLLGVYDEQTGDPVEGVEVVDVLNGNTALTTKTGTVSLIFLPDGGSLVRLRKVGYAVQTFTVPISPADTAPLTIVMTRAQTLAKVVVTDSAPRYISPNLRGFEDRKRAGFGHFIDEAEMRKDDNRTMGDVLITHFPGLTYVPGPLGAKYIGSVRKMCSGPAFAQCRSPNCYPTVYVDGVKANLGVSVGAPADWGKISPQEYAAAEFYAGGASAPPEFSGTNNECGVLVLWSRER